MKYIASCIAAAVLSVTALSGVACAQKTHAMSSSDAADFVEGNLKFHRVGSGFIQVTDTAKNQAAGTIILQAGGAPMFAPLPGYDIKTAYEKHMGGGAAEPAQAANPAKEESPNPGITQPPAPAPTTGFDAASKTVTLSGGRAVTFVDNDNLKVQIPGTAGTKTYDLHYHGTSGGQLAQVWARSEQGRTGMGSGMKGPLAGGVTITAEPADGMPGGKLYDTLEGGNLASAASLRPRLQPIVDAVKEAAELVKPIQPKLADTKVVKTLLNNNLVQ
jgi:hypothetical protein